jgi:RND family efflux transporter MFP subunit
LLKNTGTSTQSYDTKTINLVTSSIILTNQINDFLSEMLVIKNGTRNYKSSVIYDSLGTLSSESKTKAENSLIQFQKNQKQYQEFFDTHILNKKPNEQEINQALELSKLALSSGKVALESSFVMLTNTLTDQNISENTINQYKKTITDFGNGVENTLGNIDSTKSAVLQGELDIDTLKEEQNAKLSEIETQSAQIETQALTNQALIENGKLIAPFSGVISEKYLDVGNTVNVGSPILEMIDDSELKVLVQVSDEIISKIRSSQTVNVYVNGEKYEQEIKKIYPAANQYGKFTLEIELPNSKQVFKSGTIIKVGMPKVSQKSEPGIVIPKNAIISRYGQQYVFVGENNLAKKLEIKIIGSNNEFAQVQGLNEGQKVLVKGIEYLRDGDEINITN